MRGSAIHGFGTTIDPEWRGGTFVRLSSRNTRNGARRRAVLSLPRRDVPTGASAWLLSWCVKVLPQADVARTRVVIWLESKICLIIFRYESCVSRETSSKPWNQESKEYHEIRYGCLLSSIVSHMRQRRVSRSKKTNETHAPMKYS